MKWGGIKQEQRGGRKVKVVAYLMVASIAHGGCTRKGEYSAIVPRASDRATASHDRYSFLGTTTLVSPNGGNYRRNVQKD